MIKRLIEFYRRSAPGAEACAHEHIWRKIIASRQAKLISALLAGDEGGVTHFLETSALENGQCGIEDIVNWQHYANGNPVFRECVIAGLVMTLPDFLGYNNKMGAPMGFISHSKVSLILKEHNGNAYPNSMLEIGPGLGFMAVAMHRAGVGHYTMIDLPSNAVVAAYVVMKCIGEENVWLFGEANGAEAPVRFFPANNYAGVADRKYDIIYNKNGFPEIANPEQDKYVDLFCLVLGEQGFLFSANHENRPGERPLPEAMKRQSVLKCVLREPFPDMLAENTMLQDQPCYFKELYKRG